MTNRPIRLAFWLPILAASLLLAAPGAVLADCAEPAPLEKAVGTADIVFVGTVTVATNNRRWAQVAVEEVWRGPDQPATVVVRGGPEGNMMTSVDRSFEIGRTYLFVPYIDPETGALTDNSCTSTTEFTNDTARLRPADARKPLGAAPVDAGFDLTPLVPVGVALAVFGILLVVGLLARGRQET